jgi:hypothetical protein
MAKAWGLTPEEIFALENTVTTTKDKTGSAWNDKKGQQNKTNNKSDKYQSEKSYEKEKKPPAKATHEREEEKSTCKACGEWTNNHGGEKALRCPFLKFKHPNANKSAKPWEESIAGIQAKEAGFDKLPWKETIDGKTVNMTSGAYVPIKKSGGIKRASEDETKSEKSDEKGMSQKL